MCNHVCLPACLLPFFLSISTSGCSKDLGRRPTEALPLGWLRERVVLERQLTRPRSLMGKAFAGRRGPLFVASKSSRRKSLVVLLLPTHQRSQVAVPTRQRRIHASTASAGLLAGILQLHLQLHPSACMLGIHLRDPNLMRTLLSWRWWAAAGTRVSRPTSNCHAHASLKRLGSVLADGRK